MEDQKKMREQIQLFNQSRSTLPATIPFTLLADEADMLSVYRLLSAGSKSRIYTSLYRLLDKEAKYASDAEICACDDYLIFTTEDEETMRLAQSSYNEPFQGVIVRVRRDFALAELYRVPDTDTPPVFAKLIKGEQEVSMLCLVVTSGMEALPEERFESLQEMGRKKFASLETLKRLDPLARS